MIDDDWTGCYSLGWGNLIVADAYAHPAKYSRALTQRIYQHAREEGWLAPGSTVVDPFGGVALGGFDAAWNGCHWLGVELEPKFVALAEQNIAAWQQQYGHLPQWGSVRNKQIVDFPDQWRRLCESVGFRTLHLHRAWLVEVNGHQGRLDGGEDRIGVERKSFFRRLAESKGSPRIDYEVVLCMEDVR